MVENLNTGLTVEAWAEITIKEWVKKAAALRISPTDPINAERFVLHIMSSANGNPERIQFMYDYWLNFIDWGVGKGVTLEHRDMLISSGATTRRQKPWFTSVFYTQVKILTQLMAEKYALKAAHVIVNQTKYNNGEKAETRERSRGETNSVDNVTGKNKITYKEFEERRKQSGW